MRRKAIKLANLRKCVTHSTQTVFSNFKRENESQVYLPKDNWGQTKRDGDTSVPKLKTYYHGLRYVFYKKNRYQQIFSEEKPNLDHSNKSTLPTIVKSIQIENNPMDKIYILIIFLYSNKLFFIQCYFFFIFL